MKTYIHLCLQVSVLLITGSCTSVNPTKKPGNIPVTNPVIALDFPDPTVIRAEGKYYAYATQSTVNGKIINIQVASSTDLVHWQAEGDALPQKPGWASDSFWAPHVLYDEGLKKYVLFYSGESVDTATGKCLGVAFADKPTGPFTDKGTPLICGEGFVNIDPMAFKDPESGKNLLYWGSGFKPIVVQEMNAGWTGFAPGTTAKPVIFPGKEKKYTALIEGAWVDYHDGSYYMYYSGDNCCGDKASYAVLVAKAEEAMGPYKTLGEDNRTGSSVILEKDSSWTAPGHNSVFKDDKGKNWIAYHAIPADTAKASKIYKGSDYRGRLMLINRLEYKKGWPVVVR